MARTISDYTDKALRRLPPGTDPGNPEQWVNGALQRLSRAGMMSEFRPALETDLSLTLGAADTYGIQTVAIPASVLPESVIVCNSVRHSDLAAVGPLVRRVSVAELLPPHVYSTSVYGYFAVDASTLYVRRPNAALATTSNATKALAVSLLTAVSAIPVACEGLFEDILVAIFGEQGQPNQPATPDEVAA